MFYDEVPRNEAEKYQYAKVKQRESRLNLYWAVRRNEHDYDEVESELLISFVWELTLIEDNCCYYWCLSF